MNFNLALLIISIVIYPIAQLLEKKGISQIGTIDNIGQLFSPSTIGKIATNPLIITGILISVLNLLLWLGVLSKLKVSYAYTVGSISYIILALLATAFLHEKLSTLNWLGIGVVCIGVSLINFK